MKRALSTLLMLGLIAVVIGFFAAPAVAFFALRSAAQASDAEGMAALVDYPAVRASLRPQLTPGPETAPAPTIMEDPVGAIRRRLEQAATPAPDVDAYLTPAALAGLTMGEGRYAAERTRAGAPAPVVPTLEAPMPRPRYWGMNRARMAVVDEGGSATMFTFERRGAFTWKLVHVGLPDGATPEAAAVLDEAP